MNLYAFPPHAPRFAGPLPGTIFQGALIEKGKGIGIHVLSISPLYILKHVFILKPSKRPQQGAVGGRGVRGARSSPAMFRKKAKGKDDPPAQPRVSDEYGEKLTRSLSMEIRELRIREKEILLQLESRGVKADERETRPLEPPQTSVDSPRPLTLRPNTTHVCQKKSFERQRGRNGRTRAPGLSKREATPRRGADLRVSEAPGVARPPHGACRRQRRRRAGGLAAWFREGPVRDSARGEQAARAGEHHRHRLALFCGAREAVGVHSEGRDFGGCGSVPHRPELLRLRQEDPTPPLHGGGQLPRLGVAPQGEEGEPERDRQVWQHAAPGRDLGRPQGHRQPPGGARRAASRGETQEEKKENNDQVPPRPRR